MVVREQYDVRFMANEIPPFKPVDPQQLRLEALHLNEVMIRAGEMKVAAVDQTIYYPNLQSSLSVTAILEDGTSIGTHLVVSPESTQLNPIRAIALMKQAIGSRNVTKLYILGGHHETWKQQETLFPHAQGGPKSFFPAVALGYYFACPESYHLDIDSVNIRIEGEKPLFYSRISDQEIHVKPFALFKSGILNYQKYANHIQFEKI